MTDKNNQNKNKSGFNPVMAAVGVGVAVVAGATAVALSNKDNRKKVGDMLQKGEKKATQIEKDAMGKMTQLQKSQKKVMKAVSWPNTSPKGSSKTKPSSKPVKKTKNA